MTTTINYVDNETREVYQFITEDFLADYEEIVDRMIDLVGLDHLVNHMTVSCENR